VSLPFRLSMQPPKRFLVISRGRSGSNYLMSLLGSHPAIRHSGEIIGESRLRWMSIRTEIDALGWDRYVDDSFRRKGREQIAGIKVLHYQFDNVYGEQWSVADILKVADTELAVIDLRRRNLLSILASSRMAGATSQHVVVDEERRRGVQIELSAKECIKHFEFSRRMERQLGDLFQHHPIIEMFYEDLAADTDYETTRVLDFLGAERRKLNTKLLRQRTKPLSETITNLAELRDQFVGKDWEHFFTE
jgi:hypothetical protein